MYENISKMQNVRNQFEHTLKSYFTCAHLLFLVLEGIFFKEKQVHYARGKTFVFGIRSKISYYPMFSRQTNPHGNHKTSLVTRNRWFAL